MWADKESHPRQFSFFKVVLLNISTHTSHLTCDCTVFFQHMWINKEENYEALICVSWQFFEVYMSGDLLFSFEITTSSKLCKISPN